MNIPSHIAIIMDGNGRWAQAHKLPKVVGHKKGTDAVREAVKGCIDNGVDYLTLYAFSTENWKRSKDEVNALMSLLFEFLGKEVGNMKKEGIRLNCIGGIDELPQNVQDKIENVMDVTRDNKRLTLTLALNYGARSEIANACRVISADVIKGDLEVADIDERLVSEYLYTKEMPDPDLLIRTSGEMRISNFLLWQLSYSEILVMDKMWPDFVKEDIAVAVKEYSKRNRRFGGIRRKADG